jgi:hypothetical protein
MAIFMSASVPQPGGEHLRATAVARDHRPRYNSTMSRIRARRSTVDGASEAAE